jgi:hypothetical protein
MLTAKDSELDTVRALDGGADDYLAKPFGMMEMVSRVRALLRRSSRSTMDAPTKLEVGPVVLWPSRRSATLDGEPLSLTMREFDLLTFLMRFPGEVFSRETLLRRVWGWDFDGGSRTVDVHVRTLRSKLGVCGDCIETVRGRFLEVLAHGMRGALGVDMVDRLTDDIESNVDEAEEVQDALGDLERAGRRTERGDGDFDAELALFDGDGAFAEDFENNSNNKENHHDQVENDGAVAGGADALDERDGGLA